MLSYSTQTNDMLELLLYFGKRANGGDVALSVAELSKLPEYERIAKPIAFIAEICNSLDNSIIIENERLDYFFKSFDGFPASSKGAFSIANLLLEPFTPDFNGSFDAIERAALSLSREEIRYNFIFATKLNGDYADYHTVDELDFIEHLLNLDTTNDVKIKILGAYRRFNSDVSELIKYLKAAENTLVRFKAGCNSIISEYYSDYTSTDGSRQESRINLSEEIDTTVYPSIIGFNTFTGISTPKLAENNMLYCYKGIFHEQILRMRARLSGSGDDVFAMIKAMADFSRFRLLCYLREHSAYGQELSDKFELSKTTVYHHLGKLQDMGFVNCNVDGNRSYYSMNKRNLQRFLNTQRSLLLGSWYEDELS